jgi:cell division protein FtsL
MFSFEEKHPIKESKLFVEIFMRSWWVILFLIFCTVVYDQALIETNAEQALLINSYHDLQTEYQQALLEKEELLLQINSQSDYNWIELTLIKGLGVVPKGYQKVYFQLPEPQAKQ